jgi:type IV secretion system protein VirB3
MSNLRETPIQRALHRPTLLLGGERELMMIVLFWSFALMFLAMNIYSFVIGAVFLIGSIHALREMAKADPFMSKIYWQQVFFKDYYAPFSHPNRTGKNSWNSKGY